MSTLPNPYQPSIIHAQFKQAPTDFIVNEQLNIEFSETGEHLWLQVQKVNLNTTFVAKLLATWANIPIKDVGFSGLKDRHAVTIQWFSLRLPNKQLPPCEVTTVFQNKLNKNETITLLAQHWHQKKLGRGAHDSNQFIITLRDILGEKAAIDAQLTAISRHGVPNYFGEQRFGHDNQNLASALELFRHGTIHGKKLNRKFDQDKISLYLSAARSELFNALLAKRIELGNWATPLSGDVMNLDGSNSIFIPDIIDETILNRLALGDIHLTGPLWGDGELKSTGDVALLEQAVISSQPIYLELAEGLVNYGLKQQRRPLRLLPQNLNWQWVDDSTLQLDFILPSGSFATTLIAMLIK